MTFNKGGDILKYQKKDWFSHKTVLVFLHGDVFKMNLGTLSHLRWRSLQKLVMVVIRVKECIAHISSNEICLRQETYRIVKET